MTDGSCDQAAKRKFRVCWFDGSGDDRARDAFRAQTASITIRTRALRPGDSLGRRGAPPLNAGREPQPSPAADLAGLTVARGQLPDSRA